MEGCHISSNLTPEAKAAYNAYLDAKDLDDRIKKLEIFLSKVPKHKATEKIVALNKSRLSKLKAEKEDVEQHRKQILGAAEDPFSIKHEPHAIQVTMVSDFFEPGNGVGKTTLLKHLTGLQDAKPGIFTPIPLIGVFDWNKIKFQLIEQPALRECQDLNRILAGIRITDMVALMIDLSKDPKQQMEHILKFLDDHSIYLNQDPPNIKIEKTGSGKIQIFYLGPHPENVDEMNSFIEDLAETYGIKHATVKIYDDIDIDDIEKAFNSSSVFIPAIIIATKADLAHTKEHYQKLVTQYGPSSPYKFEVLPVAITYTETGDQIRKGFENFGEIVLNKLNLIRVYTKSKKGVADKPLIVQKNATVGDVAFKIHKDLFNTFEFAYIFRNKYDDKQKTRIRAGKNFTIKENDIIEIFARI